ncbi:metalloendopeptidase OMA1, mitochondrial [Trichonephila inaurata madagascariensis]|uniref:Metalloendopeptidase OMA1, mitochondrial n=1 Tax=Trichonephila inaurata madagascariensis TaxID=2747483 RepID=A0A8X6XT90_9ARAC|nr:metalloendopeptidase OMA1, mitochondrial [Trichonephila inaurata madagascariensis]
MSKFANFSSSKNPTLLTFRCLNFSRPPTFLLCKGFSSRSFPPSTISYLKVVNCRVNVQYLFRTSPPRHIPPVVWVVLRPVLKVAAVITGRSIRGWWRSLPKDKKTYLINELKANRRKIGIIMSLIFCLSLGYYISHLEYTPITDRRRFMAFNSNQITKILELEMDQLMENLGGQVLPANHPATKRVENVVNRILAANADIKELEGKKFKITVINTPAENAFVIPIGHVFVYAGMLNLCSNDDQLGIILSHEIAHCILNHGMENLSFTHLLDLCSLAIIAVIWAVIPSDTISVLSHWMFNKSIALFLQLPYNRTIETEADHVGLQLAAKACFDVRESSAFWSKMAYLSKKFGSEPEVEFLSTHPSHESRSEYLNNVMDDALKLRASCGCPRLAYGDPREKISSLIKETEASRKAYFEQHKKPVVIFKV